MSSRRNPLEDHLGERVPFLVLHLTDGLGGLDDREHHVGPGRPTKLTPELQDAICADVARGMPPVAAARRNGLHRSTYQRWMAEGLDAARRSDADEPVSEHDLRFRDFCDAIERAELDFQASLLDDIVALARPRTV